MSISLSIIHVRKKQWTRVDSTNSISTKTKTVFFRRCIMLVKSHLVSLKCVDIPGNNLIGQGDVHGPSASKQQCCGTKSKQDLHSSVS